MRRSKWLSSVIDFSWRVSPSCVAHRRNAFWKMLQLEELQILRRIAVPAQAVFFSATETHVRLWRVALEHYHAAYHSTTFCGIWGTSGDVEYDAELRVPVIDGLSSHNHEPSEVRHPTAINRSL